MRIYSFSLGLDITTFLFMRIKGSFVILFSLLFWQKGLFAQPSVDLGRDTTVCGGLLLDATTPGSSYLWSTGATTPTLQVTTTNMYWVEVTDGSGTTRDSILVTVIPIPNQAPQIADTTVCGIETVIFDLSASGNEFALWYKGLADPELLTDSLILPFLVSEPDTLTVRYANASPSQVGGLTNPSGNLYIRAEQGLVFDVNQSVILDEVEVDVRGELSFSIALLDNSNDTLINFRVHPSVGRQGIPLFYELSPGLGYQLKAYDFQGTGSLRWTNQTGYPYPIGDALTIQSAIGSSTNAYYFFFAWKTRALACYSGFDTIALNSNPVPVIDLPSKVSNCGDSVLLDVRYPGAAYQWNTGDTASTLTVRANGTYQVIASIGDCGVSDSTVVELVSFPGPAMTKDTVVCGPQTLALRATIDEQTSIFWYDDLLKDTLLGAGDSLLSAFTRTDTVYAESYQTETPSTLGLSSPTGSLYLDAELGIRFDVSAPLTLLSTTMYANTAATATVELRNAQSSVVATQNITIPGGRVPTEIFLNFDLQPGTDYELILVDIQGGRVLWTNRSLQYPYQLSELVSIKSSSTGSTSAYYYFFNLKVVQAFCPAELTPLTIDILSNPEVDLGMDTVVCQPSFLLDASYPNSQYLWSTGDTTAMIVVDSSAIYTVRANIDDCITRDTIVVDLLSIPDPLDLLDTSVCGLGPVELPLQGGTDRLLWFADSTSSNAFFFGSTYAFTLEDTTTFYVAKTAEPTRQILGAQPLDIDFNQLTFLRDTRGLTFDVSSPLVLRTVKIPANNTVHATIFLLDSNQDTLYKRRATIQGVQDVPLYWDLEPGVGYQIKATDIQGGSLGWINQSRGADFPYTVDNRLTITANDGLRTTAYYYFFDWEIAGGVCPADLTPVTVTPILPLSLPDSIYSCTPLPLSASLPAGISYTWNTGAQTEELVVDTTGTFIVSVSDGADCLVSDSVFVDIPLDAGLPPDGILCGDILTTAYTETSRFLWNTGDSTAILKIDTAGTYSVIVAEPRGCVLLDTIIVVSFDSFPEIDLGPDFSSCDSAQLDGGQAGLTYEWNNGAAGQIIKIFQSGQFIATATNENGCATQDTVSVFIANSPEADFFVEDTVYTATLMVSFLNNSSFGSYVWLFGDGSSSTSLNPIHTYTEEGEYCVQLIATDILNSCGSDTIEKCVFVSLPLVSNDLSSPNRTWQAFFTPSGYLQINGPRSSSFPTPITLVSLSGKQVFTNQHPPTATLSSLFDLSFLSPGIYFLHIFDPHHPYIIKLIKS